MCHGIVVWFGILIPSLLFFYFQPFYSALQLVSDHLWLSPIYQYPLLEEIGFTKVNFDQENHVLTKIYAYTLIYPTSYYDFSATGSIYSFFRMQKRRVL